ncbi:hypothetical protein XcodCFBP4690_15990 [Xanthomonas codiaei]|uniref:Uncharacterized protein n=1 Tax=Xanthomonas codiaei TaxID=56463 RepID=A0A2S7CIJ9_9XANT|nr:hypothetical protein XcodCFBP4690_15990 [Xanthomonas codiaei]
MRQVSFAIAGSALAAAKWARRSRMLHCSVICSLMIAIFICEQSGACRLVDVAMPSCRFPDPVQPHATPAAPPERCA